jgi:hypothetical protein
VTEPASLTAMRQLVAEARLWRSHVARRAPSRTAPDPGRSGATRPPEQEAADHGQDDGENELADAHAGLIAGEPRHRRDQEDEGDTEDEQADQPLPSGVARARGAGR